MRWFEVDKSGLAKLLERRGVEHVILELVQNALDTDAKNVHVKLEPIPGRPAANIRVEDDDPNGFRHLEHAWTLFAESIRKGDAQKRGRFNLGEKLVLAVCDEATIETTTGTVRFDKDGRHQGRTKRAAGSVFSAVIRMTREDVATTEKVVRTLLLPPGVVFVYNGERLPSREVARTFELTLPTEVADGDGVLKRSYRKTKLELYTPQPGETPHLYEMGIPIVELESGDPWHIDVGQKVPLNFNRDNVTPAYMREVRVAVLNHAHEDLTKEQATSDWAREATGDARAEVAAVKHVSTLRFGERAVAYDVSDPEGSKLAMSQGYTVIPGGSLSKEEWSSFRRAEVLPPAGRITPSPRAYSEEGQDEVKVIPPAKYTDAQRRVIAYSGRLATALIGGTISIRLVHTTNGFVACYGGRQLDFNSMRLGHAYFERAARGETDDLHELLIHELGHHFKSDHLDKGFHDALCRLGAKLARIALTEPGVLNIAEIEVAR